MASVSQDRPDVQPEGPDRGDDGQLSDADREFLAGFEGLDGFDDDPDDDDGIAVPDPTIDPDGAEGPPATSDRAWLIGEVVDYRLKADPDTLDVAGLVACALEELARAMAWHRADDATTLARLRRVDLGAVRLPAGPLRSPLAEALATEASWYLNLDTPAGTLAADAILRHAASAEMLESETVAGWLMDEAAWRAAAEEVVMAGAW